MVRIGIIGAGRIGKVHAESIMNHIPGATVAAIADPFMSEETKKWCTSLGIMKIHSDYHAILDDAEIDAVMVCSSTDTHADISIDSIKSSKHVFCEKPVSQDLNKIYEVMDMLNSSPVKFQVGFNRRFDHNFEAVKSAVLHDVIGDIHIVKITSRDPEAPSVSYVKSSGGMFLDMTIHDFDMVRFLSGSEVKEVFAVGDALVNPTIKDAGDIDTAVITLTLDNGAIAVIDNSRRAAYGYDQRAEVFGSKGQVAVSNDTVSKAVISTKEGVCQEKPLYFFLERYMASFTKEVTQFVAAIEQNTEVPVTIHDGLMPVIIAKAAKLSLDEHRPVQLSEIKA